MNDRKKIYIISGEDFNRLSDDAKNKVSNGLLRRMSILLWGYDEEKLNSCINDMVADLAGLKSFYVFVQKGDLQTNTAIMGIAYFRQDENNEKQWYCRDFIVRAKYRGPQIAKEMIEMAMRELSVRKASKLFIYVAKDGKSSILAHKKLGFIPSENQEDIDDIRKSDKIVYECNIT